LLLVGVAVVLSGLAVWFSFPTVFPVMPVYMTLVGMALQGGKIAAIVHLVQRWRQIPLLLRVGLLSMVVVIEIVMETVVLLAAVYLVALSQPEKSTPAYAFVLQALLAGPFATLLLLAALTARD
jgi:hypothetical protein